MAESVGQVALDIVMGKNTVTDVVQQAMSDCKSVISDSSADISKKIGAIGSASTQVGSALLPFSTAVSGVGIAAGKTAMDFEDAMAKVSTIADTTQVPLDDLSSAIMDLSNETGIAATDIADNVYNAISAGQQTGDAVNFVRNATSLATAGFTDSGSALDILTTIMNAYGLEASEVTSVSDKLIQTQNLGKTTVAELASSMGKIIPTAKANGVELDTLCGAYAVMTSNGIATAETTTYLNSMLNELGKQGTGAAIAFAEGTAHIKEGGLTMQEAMESGWTLTDVLSILDEQAYSTGTTIGNLFGSSEAGKAATVLWDNAQKVNSAVEQMGESAGSTTAAYEKMQTESWDLNRVQNEVKNTMIDCGGVLMETVGPIIQEVCGAIRAFTGWFSNLDDGTKKFIVTAGVFAGALGPVLIGVGKVCTGVSSVIDIGKKLHAGIGVLQVGGTAKLGSLFSFIAANPIVLIIGAIIAAGVLLITHWDEVKQIGLAVWNAIGSGATWLKETVVGAFTTMHEGVASVAGSIGGAIESGMTSAISFITSLPSQAFGWGKDIIGGIVDGIHSKISAVADAVSSVGSKIKSYLHFSVPDEGPLTDYESWMPDFMQGLASGINSNLPLIDTAVSGVADSMRIGVQAPKLSGVGGGQQTTAATTDGNTALLQRILDALDKLPKNDGGADVSVYLDGRLIDEYRASSDNRRALRSGGMA